MDMAGLSCLGVPISGVVHWLLVCMVAAAVPRRGALHGGRFFRCGVVRWAPLLTSATVWLGFGRSAIARARLKTTVATWLVADSGSQSCVADGVGRRRG